MLPRSRLVRSAWRSASRDASGAHEAPRGSSPEGCWRLPEPRTIGSSRRELARRAATADIRPDGRRRRRRGADDLARPRAARPWRAGLRSRAQAPRRVAAGAAGAVGGLRRGLREEPPPAARLRALRPGLLRPGAARAAAGADHVPNGKVFRAEPAARFAFSCLGLRLALRAGHADRLAVARHLESLRLLAAQWTSWTGFFAPDVIIAGLHALASGGPRYRTPVAAVVDLVATQPAARRELGQRRLLRHARRADRRGRAGGPGGGAAGAARAGRAPARGRRLRRHGPTGARADRAPRPAFGALRKTERTEKTERCPSTGHRRPSPPSPSSPSSLSSPSSPSPG